MVGKLVQTLHGLNEKTKDYECELEQRKKNYEEKLFLYKRNGKNVHLNVMQNLTTKLVLVPSFVRKIETSLMKQQPRYKMKNCQTNNKRSTRPQSKDEAHIAALHTALNDEKSDIGQLESVLQKIRNEVKMKEDNFLAIIDRNER